MDDQTRLRIKNWDTFQHYKKRTPPWIKLHRSILDEIEWFALSGDAAKALVMMWIIASEKDGELPDSKTLAFRLRIDSKTLESLISELKHYLASTPLADCKQDATLETEGEAYPETETKAEIEGESRDPLPMSFIDFIGIKGHVFKDDVQQWRAVWGKLRTICDDATAVFDWAIGNYDYPVKPARFFVKDSWPTIWASYNKAQKESNWFDRIQT